MVVPVKAQLVCSHCSYRGGFVRKSCTDVPPPCPKCGQLLSYQTADFRDRGGFLDQLKSIFKG